MPLTVNMTELNGNEKYFRLSNNLSNFSFRNVTDDRQLQDLVGRARELLQGVAADDLRTNGDMRARVQQGIAALALDLDGMLVKSGGRKMRLAEDELTSQL